VVSEVYASLVVNEMRIDMLRFTTAGHLLSPVHGTVRRAVRRKAEDVRLMAR
jgi:hypothetical protein